MTSGYEVNYAGCKWDTEIGESRWGGLPYHSLRANGVPIVNYHARKLERPPVRDEVVNTLRPHISFRSQNRILSLRTTYGDYWEPQNIQAFPHLLEIRNNVLIWAIDGLLICTISPAGCMANIEALDMDQLIPWYMKAMGLVSERTRLWNL